MFNVKVSLATDEDLDIIVEIIKKAYQPIAEILTRPPGALVNMREEIKQRIKDKRVYKVIWNKNPSDGKVIGTFDLYTDNDYVANFSHFAIEPGFQRKGIGHEIMREVDELARKQGAKSIYLEIYKKAPYLFYFYKKHGFEKIGKLFIKGETIYMLTKKLV